MDVKTAFLYRFINHLVYVDIPNDFQTEANQEIVYKLLKALYGLKKTPRLWYKRLSNFLLQKLELAKIIANHNISITPTGFDRLMVSTFVDDIKIMASKDSDIISQIK